MKRFLWLLIIFTLTPMTYAQTTYTILAEDAAGLWGQADGTGAGNDIVKAAYAAMGVEVKLLVVPYNRCKTFVMTGHALACFGMGRSDELKGKVIFPQERIYTNTATIFVRKSDAYKHKSIADIRPKTSIGTVLGYEYPDTFMRLLTAKALVVDNALNESQSLQKLAVGRIDLAIANIDDLKNAEYLIKQAGVTDSVETAFELESAGTFLGFAIGDPKTAAAIKAFDAGMAIIRRDGTLTKILNTWKAKLATK